MKQPQKPHTVFAVLLSVILMEKPFDISFWFKSNRCVNESDWRIETHEPSLLPCQSVTEMYSESDARIQSQSMGQVSQTDGDEEIKVGELDGAAVQMATETDPSPS